MDMHRRTRCMCIRFLDIHIYVYCIWMYAVYIDAYLCICIVINNYTYK